MSAIIETEYYNSIVLKKVVDTGSKDPLWPNVLPANNAAGTANTVFPGDADVNVTTGAEGGAAQYNWYLEESRIRGGYNNTSMNYGIKAYIVEENIDQKHRFNSLIYSGVYNSATGFNQTNQFSTGEAITRSLDPIHGSIERLFAEDTNLIVFQENKVSKALIDKDTIYTAESGTQTQAANVVIGQAVPYLGTYGISENPESFAFFGYRKYFADKNRNAILRLSRDGITEISNYGMLDYFRDYLATITDDWNRVQSADFELDFTVPYPAGTVFTFKVLDPAGFDRCDIQQGAAVEVYYSGGSIWKTTTAYVSKAVAIAGGQLVTTVGNIVTTGATYVRFITYTKHKIIGGWDIHSKNFVVSLQTNPPQTSTGDDTYDTVIFDELINGWTTFQSYKPVFVGSLKNKYYSFFNASIWEHYYESPNDDSRSNFYDAGIAESSITFIFNPNPSVMKNFQTIGYEGNNGWKVISYTSDPEGFDQYPPSTGPWSEYEDTTNSIYSYDEGAYITDGVTHRAGFERKENRYVANLVSASAVRPGEIIYGNQVSGIKGYFTTVMMAVDTTTDLGGKKELYSVSSKWVVSSVN